MKVSKEVKIGLISIVVIACFIFAFNFFKKKDVFDSQNKFYAVYKNVDGLAESDALIINGYKVGSVSDINLASNSSKKVTVTMLVDNKVKVPKNSVARIIRSDIIGSKVIRLVLGSSEKYAVDGDTLLPENEESFQQSVEKVMKPLQKKVDSLLSSVDSVINTASANQQKTTEIIYKVLILSSDKKIPFNAAQFKNMESMGVYADNGVYKYTSGEYAALQDAIESKKRIRNNGFNDAFVIATKDGKRIPLK